MISKRLMLILVVIGLAGLPAAVEAGGLGKVFGRVAMKKLLQRDAARDAATVVKPLASERRVFRYTTRQQAERESAQGLASGRHMTSGVKSGRPLSAQGAQRRYGLPARPEVRETWRLPAGTPVRKNKVLGGKPGYGEITSPKRMPPAALEKRVDLNKRD